jgi:hypothetical protein
MANSIKKTVYLTQGELAKRWRCSEGTIINRRKNGIITYFKLPGSDKPLYPYDEILAIEEEHTKQTKPKGGDKKKKSEIKKVEPCVSAPQIEWRI